MPEACPVCRPRKPHLTPFYQCVQDHYDTFERVYEERFAKRFILRGRFLLTSHTMGLGFLIGLHFSKPLLLVTDSSV